jgi:co-chaperonin GroES (HSP10)
LRRRQKHRCRGKRRPGGIIIPDTAKEKPSQGEIIVAADAKWRPIVPHPVLWTQV